MIFGNKISKYLASIEQSVGNPMAFLDSELHTIAVSSENYSEVSMRTLFDHRKIETEKIYQWKEKSFPELQVQLEFPMLVSEPFAIRRIFSRLILGGNIYFLECAEYTKKFEDSDLAFLYYVSNILEQFLPTRDSIWGTDKTIEGFFERIVMDSESDVKYMKRQAYALRFPKEGITWRMMLFTNQKFSSYEESTIYIRKLRSLTDAIVFYYRYNIIMIIEDTKVQKFTEELDLKNEEKYFCCVSLPYSEVKYLKEAYKQCSYIYEKIDENTKCMILPYEKFMLSHFYKNVLKSSFETEPFILPIIKIIFKYDKDNKTNYIQILYQYILNFRNIDKTAEDLHIHRNTVIYRLGKVTELFGIDMNNYHVLHNLKNSIEILRAKHD